MVGQEILLADANVFMTPFRFYYAFDLVPAYWDKLKPYLISGRVVILDIVKDEIDKGKDDLAKWLSDIEGLVVVPKATEDTVKCYQEVMRYIAESGYYRPDAVATWAPSTIADPWLIAVAKANGYTIVTQEVASGGLSKKTPNKVAKIPDVARHFGVKTINIYDMMRKLEISIK